MKPMNCVSAMLMALMCVIMSSCREDIVPAPMPFTIDIYVKDKNGNNLLDPTVECNIPAETLKIVYKGETYTKDIPQRTIIYKTDDGKTYPEYRRFYIYMDRAVKDFHLCFGDFGFAFSDYDNEEITIEWYDGTKDVISFSMGWKDGIKYEKFMLNGKENPDGKTFTVVKEPYK